MPGPRTTTAYNLVARELRRRILSGRIAAGEQLPPERELCTLHSASRITIRRALEILEEERLVQRAQGKGTFVSPAPNRQIPLLDADFLGSVAAHAPEMERRLAERRWQDADPALASVLNLSRGQRVLFACRLDLLDGDVIAYDDVYLPEPFADRLGEDDLGRMDFLERWQEVQSIAIGFVAQTIAAVPADRTIRHRLPVPRGTPVLRGEEVFHLAGDRPAGVFTSYYRHDRFRLKGIVRLGRPGTGNVQAGRKSNGDLPDSPQGGTQR